MKAVVFDFDGVLVESNDIKTEAFAHVFARFPSHFDAMMDFHHTHVSATRFAKFDHLLELLGRKGDRDLYADLSSEFSAFTTKRVASAPLVPGAIDLLEWTRARAKTYLASVTPESELLRILAALELTQFFVKIYGCPPWSKVRAIHDVRESISALPSDIVLVGDSAGDQQAARESGVVFVPRNSGLPFDPPLPRAGKDLWDVRSILQAML
jgi:phosphoglycolate phosphatase